MKMKKELTLATLVELQREVDVADAKSAKEKLKSRKLKIEMVKILRKLANPKKK